MTNIVRNDSKTLHLSISHIFCYVGFLSCLNRGGHRGHGETRIFEFEVSDPVPPANNTDIRRNLIVETIITWTQL